ncbi:peptidoglycan DD-metalloendopeptidase family protein [Burkholderiaceae bacterium FT117]|uniref:peptidoglycan DD-metalloendopeptidase family protein n=1 Tax=Zeimonas sediminis TaxID=2944268 RepID=UPI002342C2BD|nr:peptidoglycan DD-metalloendopeptidase family protein [Zeimonas sediminis]MCM5572427.1 peptidoglycan DD-metalloendopeptidase family protein [Zeimonas sediminis]
MTRISDPRFNKVAVAVAATLTFAAVTAFGVAPLREAELPAPETVVESLVFQPEIAETPDSFVQTERIRRGETLASLLERLGAADADFLQFASSDKSARKLLQLYAGRSVTAEIDGLGRVMSLQYRYGNLVIDGQENATRLTIKREGEGFVAVDEPVPLDRHTAMAAVTINSSLFAATDAAGIPDRVASMVADILDGEVDFRRDLRRGAELRVLYETVREADSLDGPVGTRVLAVQLLNDGERHEAVWFERDDGKGEFFGFDGRGMRKAFLRNPIEFSRVSSGFTNRRLHPVFGSVRAHKGVDFAAPSGTPVRASGSGVVDFAGWQNGYGKVVVLRHRNGVETLYAHLRGFASGLNKGDKVEQGEVIGYVGMTGWATGPHLHYEFMVDGRQVDPMKVAMPESEPLEAAERERFASHAEQVAVQLAQLDPLRIAARFE